MECLYLYFVVLTPHLAMRFLPRNAMLARYKYGAVSVRLSVCLSQALGKIAKHSIT